MLPAETLERLIPRPLTATEEWEARYPAREVPAGAEVTRFAPSPTGYVHIGGIYVSLIARSVAHDSGGVFFVRIEDTDRAREVADAVDQIGRALTSFDLRPDEGWDEGPYGPYFQSERGPVYDSFVADLLDRGNAYPCFCTREDLAEKTKAQQKAGVPTGYYGEWATCRDLGADEVRAKLDGGEGRVIRFRAPAFEGAPSRIGYEDRIRGTLDLEANRNDVVIRKSIGLPTYHFAHAVDDHLMRVTTVIRGDEWISSVPLHLQLFDALGFDRIAYAHIAPLMKVDGKSKRKLSKRKDPEANVDFYLSEGYPIEGVACYLRGMANSRLIDRPCAETAGEPIRLEEASVSGQLVDLPKLDSICRDYVAELPVEEVVDRLTAWAEVHDPELATVLVSDRDMAVRALSLETADPDRPRKVLAKWSDFRGEYGFLLPSLFTPVTDPGDERFEPLDAATVGDLARHVAAEYRHDGDGGEWFSQIRDAASAQGFAPGAKQFKQEPDKYRGSIREAANVIRVLITGSRQSPDMFEVTRALGEDEVRRRLASLSDR